MLSNFRAVLKKRCLLLLGVGGNDGVGCGLGLLVARLSTRVERLLRLRAIVWIVESATSASWKWSVDGDDDLSCAFVCLSSSSSVVVCCRRW